MKVVLPIATCVLAALVLQVAVFCLLLGTPVLLTVATVVGSWLVVTSLAGLCIIGTMLRLTMRNQKRQREQAQALVGGASAGEETVQ